MTSILQAGWTAAVVGALCYAATTVAVWQSPDLTALVPRKQAQTAHDILSFGRFGDSELDQYIANLRQQRAEMEGRERKLKEWEDRLRSEHEDLNRLLAEVEKRQASFDKQVVRLRTEELPALKKLARIYTAMSPTAAGAVFVEMSDEELVKVLAQMKDTEATPLLEAFASRGPKEARRVALLCSRLQRTLIESASPAP